MANQSRDDTVGSGVFTIDATKSPKEIDILDKTAKINEMSRLEICELDGDTYKFCLAPPGKLRPTEFVSKPGGGNSLGVSKREKR